MLTSLRHTWAAHRCALFGHRHTNNIARSGWCQVCGKIRIALPASWSEDKQRIIASAAVGVQQFLDWASKPENKERIYRQYRAGILRDPKRDGFEWYADPTVGDPKAS